MDTPRNKVSSANPIHIPIEIVDEILDYLRTDKPSFQKCALVCRSWTPSCRRHIFACLNFEVFSDLMNWCRCIPATPNGPHLFARQLTINDHYLWKGYYRSPDGLACFLQHFTLFSNVQDLVVECSPNAQTLDHISISDIFGHLSDTLRSLSVRSAFCSPEALISLIASFRNMERLELAWVWFGPSKSPRAPPQRRTFKGTFHMTDWDDSSEDFVALLSEHDLLFHEMHVCGENWLRSTAWNRCLARCVDHLDNFSIHWSESGDTPVDQEFRMLTFKNLRQLSIRSSLYPATVLPPPQFLSSITSTQLSEITIDVAVFPPGDEFDQVLDTVRSYDEALCLLSNQFKSPGDAKLKVTLKVVEAILDPKDVLPRLSEVGGLEVVATGM